MLNRDSDTSKIFHCSSLIMRNDIKMRNLIKGQLNWRILLLHALKKQLIFGLKAQKKETKSMKLFQYILFVSVLLFTLQSCADDMMSSQYSMPPAFGKVNEVTVLANQQMWDGAVGDTLDFYYTGAFPITPTPEPMLDLRHFNHYEITKSTVFKHYRTYLILANLADRESPMTQMVIQDIGEEKYRKAMKDPSFNSIVGKNKWAKGQILIYMFAPSESQLIDVIRQKLPDVVERIYEHDLKQIKANTYASGEHIIAQNTIMEMMQVSSKIPGDFVIAKKSMRDNMIWLRKDQLDKSIENIVIRSIPYVSEQQFSVDSIIALVEDFGSKHIEDNEIQVNDVDLPTYQYVRDEDNRYIMEIRGIWEAKKKFMGGSYIAYLIKDKNSDQLIFALSFIYAPGEKKRNLIQKSDIIIRQLLTSVDNG